MDDVREYSDTIEIASVVTVDFSTVYEKFGGFSVENKGITDMLVYIGSRVNAQITVHAGEERYVPMSGKTITMINTGSVATMGYRLTVEDPA
jgi:hypothetical protein